MFREHYIALSHFARKYLGDLDTGKEIVHHVFFHIWESRTDFDFDKPAKSYLFTSVYNRCMNYLRDQKKFTSAPESFAEEITEATTYTDQLEVAELEASIQSAIAKLPEKCREVFMLNRFEGKKYAEIAEMLHISVKTVEAQMSKALKILREELKEFIFMVLLWFYLN